MARLPLANVVVETFKKTRDQDTQATRPTQRPWS